MSTFLSGDTVKLSAEGRQAHVTPMFDWEGRVIKEFDGWVYVKWDRSPGPCPVCSRGPAKEVWTERPEFLEFMEIQKVSSDEK